MWWLFLQKNCSEDLPTAFKQIMMKSPKESSMPRANITPANIKPLMPFADAVVSARALAKAMREKVDAIEAGVLAADVYTTKPRTRGGKTRGPARITTPSGACRMTAEQFGVYLRNVGAAYKAAGFDMDSCPALIARNEQEVAERALIEAARGLPGCQDVTNRHLLRGTKAMIGLDVRKKYLDMLITMAQAASRLDAIAA